jgi:EAL domain-containing protein (putative c-di-GMP-specific phosphodiesterase class I)
VPDTAAVPLIVASATVDPVEALNSLLRRNAVAAHCTWLASLKNLPETLQRLNPQLLICVTPTGNELPAIARVRNRIAPDVPLLAIRPETNDWTIASDMGSGACDSVAMNCPERIYAVIARELKARQTQRELRAALRSAQDYRQQLDTLLTLSNDAIAVAQEGIITRVNASWLMLMGITDANALLGQPAMDLFNESTHAALRTAIAACQQGRHDALPLRASLLTQDGGSTDVELMLSSGQRDGEPCVHLIVPAPARRPRASSRSATRTDTGAQSPSEDTTAKQISAALQQNRFRLVQQPITRLDGEGLPMFDTLLRMTDATGRQILPASFMPVAERHGLVRAIDRWMLHTAARAAHDSGGCLFVPLSQVSALDATLLPWLRKLLASMQLDPQRLCIEVTEATATTHLNGICKLAQDLHDIGLRFALAAFGADVDSIQLLERVPLDFIKIDGSLIRGLSASPSQQDDVRALVETASQRGIGTIAERADNANTMALLWKMGVQYLQGHLTQAPEDVRLGVTGTGLRPPDLAGIETSGIHKNNDSGEPQGFFRD